MAAVVRPIVGITAYYERRVRWGAWELPAALVPWDYVAAVEAGGGRPLLVPPSDDGVDETLDALDALLFSGGSDLDPSLYGAEPHPETTGVVERRDRAELALLRAALERDLPGARRLPRLAAAQRRARRRSRPAPAGAGRPRPPQAHARRLRRPRRRDRPRQPPRRAARRPRRRQVAPPPGDRRASASACASSRGPTTARPRPSRTRGGRSPSASCGTRRRARTGRSSRRSSTRLRATAPPAAERLPEQLVHPRDAVVEDRVELPPHPRLDQRAARRAIADVVVDLRAAAAGRQAVRVLPEQVRAAQLDVDEAARRRPLADLRQPPQGDAVQPQPVPDQSAGAELGGRVDDPERQPRRRDRLEVRRVGEERERLVGRARRRPPSARASGRAGSGWPDVLERAEAQLGRVVERGLVDEPHVLVAARLDEGVVRLARLPPVDARDSRPGISTSRSNSVPR